MSPAVVPGRLLARGRWADVYELGGGRVLKRYRDPATAAMAAYEAAVMAHARSNSIPVPEVHEVRGCDLVLDKVTGPTMLAELTTHLHQLGRHARTLADLHRLVHAVTAPPGLRQPFGPGDAFLHMDLHPDNVILSPSGPVLIDWQGAAAGPAPADMAQTWLLLRTSVIPRPFWQRMAGSLGQRAFATAFLRQFGAAEVNSQLRVVATRRLEDASLLPAEAVRIRRILRACAADGSGP
jgi:tRNA A-37 threonylcarbamoyl transferase component Bud32